MGPEATWDTVHEELPRHAWAHFGCHAVQNFDEPLSSRLTLHDRDPTVADLTELPRSATEFAMLAARTTAADGSLVRDEWVSLAAALMHAEYQAVIGTLWPVPDGPRRPGRVRGATPVRRGVAGRRGRRCRAVEVAPGAHALHRALLRERARRPGHPSAWVSFVHYGV